VLGVDGLACFHANCVPTAAGHARASSAALQHSSLLLPSGCAGQITVRVDMLRSSVYMSAPVAGRCARARAHARRSAPRRATASGCWASAPASSATARCSRRCAMSRPTTRRGSEPAARARPGLARRAPTRPGRPVRAAPTGLRSVLGGQTRVRRGSDCPGWGASRRQARRRPPSAHAHYRRVWEHTCAGRCAPAQCARPGQEQARAARVRGRLRWRARAASPAGVCRRHPSRRVAVPGLDRACRMFSLLRGGSATARAPHAPVRRGGRSGRRGPRAPAGSGCPAAGVMSLLWRLGASRWSFGRCRVLELFAVEVRVTVGGAQPQP